MPRYQVTNPATGQVVTLEGATPPTDADLDEVFASLDTQTLPKGGGQQEKGFIDTLSGIAEPLATVASSAIAAPVSGIAGLVGLLDSPEQGAANVKTTQEAMTFKPRTQEGQENLQAVGEALQPVGEAISSAESTMGDFVMEQTGSPALAAAAFTTPTALMEALGLGLIKKARSGTRLIDDAGRPTKQLEKMLNKQGLVYDNLTDVAKAEIPNIAPKRLLSAPKADTVNIAENALVKQIKSGARDDALAPLMVVGNKVQADKLGAEAIKQGFESGFVQAVKTASPQTRKGMDKMLGIMERIQGNKRLALDMRPSIVVGDSVGARIKFIRDKANNARKELGVIAEKQLTGKSVDATPVLNKLSKSFDDLDIKVTGDGKPVLNFDGSMISKDRTSQRIIQDLVDLMAEGGRPDALRMHKMKRQIDKMIDFRKKSEGGLTDAGKGVLKDIRSSLNDSIRGVSDDYARVNDIMSQSIGSLDDFQKAAGSSIDIFGKGSNKAIGQKSRSLMSNIQSRVKLENALDSVEDVARNLGGKFDDDIKDLSFFANSLENRFGAVAETSLKGEFGSALKQAKTEGLTGMVINKTFEQADKLRGINDFNAFRAMSDLVKRQK